MGNRLEPAAGVRGPEKVVRKVWLMWKAFSILVSVWFVLKFVLHKGVYVHIILIAALSVLVVQIVAHRKTQYHKTPADGELDRVLPVGNNQSRGGIN